MQWLFVIAGVVSLLCAAALVPIYRRTLRRHEAEAPPRIPPRPANVIPFERRTAEPRPIRRIH